MKADWPYIVILGACFALLFVSAEWLYHSKKWQPEYTRKWVHTGTGLLTLLFPVWLSSVWSVLLLCSLFFIILIVSLYFKWLGSINDIPRKSFGSFLYPVAVFACFYFYTYSSGHQIILFYLPILLLAICDPVAALVGQRWPYRRISFAGSGKTLSGMAAFFLLSIVLSAVAFTIYSPRLIVSYFLCVLLVSVTATLAEFLSINGTDNLTIPLATLAVLNLVI